MRPRDGGEGLRTVAWQRLSGTPGLELYVCGHSHVQALERTPSGGIFANPGAWMDGPTALRILDDRVALVRADGPPRVVREITR